MSRFEAIRSARSRPEAQPVADPVSAPSAAARTPARVGKKAVSGYFTPELSRAIHLLALEQNTSLQALLGEALDDLLRKYGKHPFGER
ncbi:MAG: hypothetical protein GC203_10595 [Phenylobacterium sp.]|uniref:ribbon-helix-helix domain-containing protein n=1 Tax=Phenylobacterium sp. TaxID=1871053 RepID=UPI0025DAC505|nr:ribbon-helix-helix domain-containing protein [Phenylobacterium sp.]MBI1198299.1 hypothetical protein [Phenylobacterium sp.]